MRAALKELGLDNTSSLAAARASYEILKRRIESRLASWAEIEKDMAGLDMQTVRVGVEPPQQPPRFAIRDAYIASWIAEREAMERGWGDFDPDHMTAGAVAGFYLHTFGPLALWFFDSTAHFSGLPHGEPIPEGQTDVPLFARRSFATTVRDCIKLAMAVPVEKTTEGT